ncbi:hypothetical protein [Sinomonas atrocyanea]|uniref:hypothetical protein n=1 Tax=Sinomonas atrocyanea TaxID=37927 RepID=UPI003D97B00F
MHPSSRPSRLLRGLSAATVATLGALASHLAGGGAVPGLLGVAVPWVLAVFVCTGLAGRGLSFWRLALGISASQLLFHTLFVLGTTPHAPLPPSARHLHGAAAPGTALPADGAMADAMGGEPSMWLAHAVAALLTIAAFHRGERAIARLRELAVEVLAWAREGLRLDLPVVVPVRRAYPTAARHREAIPCSAPQRCAVQRRGPPRPFPA